MPPSSTITSLRERITAAVQELLDQVVSFGPPAPDRVLLGYMVNLNQGTSVFDPSTELICGLPIQLDRDHLHSISVAAGQRPYRSVTW